jgi:hypothetical protein
MSVLRYLAIIVCLFIISTSSAPHGIEFGIKMKFFLGRDEKAVVSTMPKFEIKMPGQQLPIGVKGDLGIEEKQQQLPFQVPPQAMDIMMAMMKPLMDSEVTQQVLANVMG